ncbi:MAG: TRZ/ATZ family protein [Ruminococcaceae bacterium]|nr:TRZ/ATZ family protein [Oscillospiraceae bacterium]
MSKIYCNLQELQKIITDIHAGDELFLSGVLYTARDAAHKKMLELINDSKELPFDIKGASIYYAGPTEARPGTVIGSCGPTTSSRMDKFAPTLLDLGLSCMIGKGCRSDAVIEAIVRNRALYLCAVGGAGAYISSCITSCEVIAFPELGCESVKKLTVKDMPVFCAIDSFGNDIFKRNKI